MIRLEAVVTRIDGVGRDELDDWIARGWLSPAGDPPEFLFQEADLERVRLVRDLRHAAGIAEDSLAVVLALLDQVAELRHALARVLDALRDLPAEQQAELLRRLRH
jgi:chaperone modulatory protein CbpM